MMHFKSKINAHVEALDRFRIKPLSAKESFMGL